MTQVETSEQDQGLVVGKFFPATSSLPGNDLKAMLKQPLWELLAEEPRLLADHAAADAPQAGQQHTAGKSGPNSR